MSRRDNWNIYKLESVAALVSGRTPEREQKEYYAAEGTPWVKIENLDQGFVTEATEYLSEKGKEKVNLVPENSVLFSIVGTVGKVGIAGCELATNQQIVSLIFEEEKVLPMYGYYYLRYYADEIRKLSNQTTMALINRKTLGQYRIRVPQQLQEQQEIVEKLGKFEAYARQKEHLRQEMERYAGLLFWKMFSQEIRFHEKLSLKEFLRESISSGIPKDEEPQCDFACIRANDFEKPYLCEEHTSEDAEVLALDDIYQLQEGDVLLRNGKLFLAEAQTCPIYIERNILCLRTKTAQLLPEVLYAWLNLPQISAKLYTERKAGESRKRPIRASELENMQIPYFSMSKQKEFAKFLKKIRQIQRSLDEEIVYAWKVFHAMAYKYFEEKEELVEEEIVFHTDSDDDFASELRSDDSSMEVTESFETGSVKSELVKARLILAIVCGWYPRDHRANAYCQKRREIFRKAQPYFQPVALSFVTQDGQKEQLLSRDFLTYHSEKICEEWIEPLDYLKYLLREETIVDAHLAFQGEHGIVTEDIWESELVMQMAREGLLLLTVYSGLEDYSFLM